MDFFVCARERNPNPPIRVHPLLLSLTATINASEIHPDIGTISENDERVLRSKHYVSSSAFPPLEIHFSGQNGSSLLSNRNGYALTSTAGCRECVALSPQDNSGDDFATQGDSEETSHPPGDNSARIRSEFLSMHNKGKKRRRASSASAQGDLSNARSYYKAARAIRRVKGKQATKAGLSDANPSPMVEEKSNKSSQEDRDWEAEPCMFAGVSAQQYTDGIRWSLKV